MTPLYTPDQVSIISRPDYVEVMVNRDSEQLRVVIGCHERRQLRLVNLMNRLERAKVDNWLSCMIVQQTQAALSLVEQLNARTP